MQDLFKKIFLLFIFFNFLAFFNPAYATENNYNSDDYALKKVIGKNKKNSVITNEVEDFYIHEGKIYTLENIRSNSISLIVYNEEKEIIHEVVFEGTYPKFFDIKNDKEIYIKTSEKIFFF